MGTIRYVRTLKFTSNLPVLRKRQKICFSKMRTKQEKGGLRILKTQFSIGEQQRELTLRDSPDWS